MSRFSPLVGGLLTTLAILLVSLAMPVIWGPAVWGSHAWGNDLTVPRTISIPAGRFWTGSSPEEREAAYQLDENAYGHSRTRERQWYARERSLKQLETEAYRITADLITNVQYAAFVRATAHRVPDVTEEIWRDYGLIHPYTRTRRHSWQPTGVIPEGREGHPVVLVSYDDAQAFAEWISAKSGSVWRLPTEEEWEKAARGTEGRWFPWSYDYDPEVLNSHDSGPFDTLPVGSFPAGNSPFGVRDTAGQVFEWTSSTYSAGRYVVKGGSWDDKGCGICRPAARHTRPQHLKHILIGFRLVNEM